MTEETVGTLDEPVCRICERVVQIHEGMEHTGICDHCAQGQVEFLTEELRITRGMLQREEDRARGLEGEVAALTIQLADSNVSHDYKDREYAAMKLRAETAEAELTRQVDFTIPFEPTDNMLRSGRSAQRKSHQKHENLSGPMSHIRMIYRAMLVAAFVDSVSTETREQEFFRSRPTPEAEEMRMAAGRYAIARKLDDWSHHMMRAKTPAEFDAACDAKEKG